MATQTTTTFTADGCFATLVEQSPRDGFLGHRDYFVVVVNYPAQPALNWHGGYATREAAMQAVRGALRTAHPEVVPA